MPRRMFSIALPLLLIALPVAEAQRVVVLGDTVRVAPVGVSWQVRGVVESVTESGVTIRQADGEATEIHPHRIRLLQVLDGRASGLGRGALIGAGTGALVGAVVGLTEAGSGGDIGAEAVPIGMLTVGLVGGLVGAALGGSGSRERWIGARFQPLSTAGSDALTLVWVPGGASGALLAVRLRW